ncbi:MAG: tRNA lysidine(34) synthetase TilS [Candidatus Polarisedimenticolaceae bacterium]|nr:tRNA lysidine(34) synthetase TilS [Candidatus Polarisedimenticolaceae bacterium]
MAFTPAHLLQILNELPSPRRYLIALSGGCDSVVLLHAMAAIRDELPAGLVAVHINHGLQPDAPAWAAHCTQISQQLGIELIQIALDLQIAKGESLEAAARDARYRAIKAHVAAGDMLLTAQHQDDQAETLLLQLLRGSGPSGLAAMPRCASFGAALHARPLLAFTRKQLQQHAVEQGLLWMEDQSNQDLRFDRNFLRQEIMPLLAQRWPALSQTLSRSAQHCAEAQQLIDSMAIDDLEKVEQSEGRLSVQGLVALPAPQCRAVLRAWIQREGFQLPDTRHLDRIQKEMLQAAPDRNPLVSWAGCELRRYREQLYLMSPLAQHDPGLVLSWDGETPLQLPANLGLLTTGEGDQGIDPATWQNGNIEIRFRQGGERCQLAGRNHSHSLKKLLQERGVPPWERGRIPLVFIDNQLAAIAGLWVCKPFIAQNNRSGTVILKTLNNPG